MNRRSFLAAGSGALLAGPRESGAETISLNGEWKFKRAGDASWRNVTVPHAILDYLGKASYQRTFFAPEEWRDGVVRIEFQAVYHTALVTINGKPAGVHRGKGYTAFTIDISGLLEYGRTNQVAVETDNAFFDKMLPRGNSFDWTVDGGIYRPVRLLVTPKQFIDRLEIAAKPDLQAGTATVNVRSGNGVKLSYEVIDDATGEIVARSQNGAEVAIPRPKLWHFDHPNIYRIRAQSGSHVFEDTFGIRTFEAREGAFHLNGERMKVMGVERMAGSYPQFGMAEPAAWIDHDHRDMKNLNCVFTRVHWMQDQRVLDFCDREGMMMQLEVPTWGPATFKGMDSECDSDILANGLEQLREMIAQNRNHPSIVSWGLCNEIGGQNPPAKHFAREMFKEARRLDPSRLLSYASHSLRQTPERDVAAEMDIIEWNEYWESWQPGTPRNVEENLALLEKAFPGKVIVTSEYGLCECNPRNPVGDARRIEIMRDHDAIFRRSKSMGGLIFFCYNDYRTHIGDKGEGVLKQRVHGVVDVYGNRKPSYEALRRESSPIESLEIGSSFEVKLRTRDTIPAYTLRGYVLRWTIYGYGGLPMEQHDIPLPDLPPGAAHTVALEATGKGTRLLVDIVRPTGYSAASAEMKLRA